MQTLQSLTQNVEADHGHCHLQKKKDINGLMWLHSEGENGFKMEQDQSAMYLAKLGESR